MHEAFLLAARVFLSLLGLGVSVYLTVTHLAPEAVPLACSGTGVINCEAVTNSPWSMVGPIPVAAMGVVWFLVTLGFLYLRARSPNGRSRLLVLAWTVLGLLFVFYLISTELFFIGALCLWCTVVHILVIAIFLLSVSDYVGSLEPEGG